MPEHDNYFEEAYSLCKSKNPIVARTSEALYQTMLQLHQSEGVQPEGDFNMFFFFKSVVMEIASNASVELNLDDCPESSSISVVKLPESLAAWKESYLNRIGILNDLVTRMKRSSVSNGLMFDAEYAIRVASLALDEKALEWICGRGAQPELFNIDDDFDYWLSGFNSE